LDLRCLRRAVGTLVFLLLPLLLLCSCSVKLLYNNADRFIRWEVSDLVDFDRQQQTYFDGQLAHVLYWHRRTQLPLYAELFASMPQRAAQGISTDQFAAFTTTAEGWGGSIEGRMLPVATQILLSLSPRQVQQLPQRLDKANAEFLEDEQGKTLEQDRKRWGNAVAKGYRRFIGRLTSEQRQYLQTKALSYQSERDLWVAYRKRWQAQMLTQLQSWAVQEVSAQQFADFMVELSTNRQAYTGEFEAVGEANRRLAAEVSAWLLSNLTPAQQDKFSDMMEDIAGDLRELAADLPQQKPPPMPCLISVAGCEPA
jgi:hypothetical protein